MSLLSTKFSHITDYSKYVHFLKHNKYEGVIMIYNLLPQIS